MPHVLLAVLALACAAGCAESKKPPPDSAWVANPAAAPPANSPAPAPVAQTPPDPPSPPPARTPAKAAVPRVTGEKPAPADSVLYFDDDFAHGGNCARSRGRNGFGWGEAQTRTPDSVFAVRDGASPSGCALAFVFGGNPDLADDAWAEQRFKLGQVRGEPVREVFVGFIIATPPNYHHRDAKGPDNNKLLRLWDRNYNKSMLHLGMSVLPRRSPAGSSQLLVEYGTPKGTGNFGTGPWSPAFRANAVDTIGFYVRASSGIGIPDGVIRVWWNRRLVYDHANLMLAKAQTAPGAFNGIGNGYLLGWANSGFTERTELRVWRFLMAPQPVEWFLPAR